MATKRKNPKPTMKAKRQKPVKATDNTKQPTQTEIMEILRTVAAFWPILKEVAPVVWHHLEQWLPLFWQMWGNG